MTVLSTKRLGDLVLEAKPGFACGEEAEDGIFQIRMNNITRDGRLDLSKRRMVPAQRPGMADFLLRTGDVIFNATNSPDMVGKTALIGATDEPTVFSNHFLRLRVDPSILLPAYLSRWLHLQFDRGTFKAMCRQWVNQATVGRDALLGLAIPLPPIEEQRRIAEVLDRADELRAKRREVLAHLDDLTQSIFLDMFGDPAQNSKELPVAPLGKLGQWTSGGTPPRSRKEYFEGEVPWFSSGELGEMYVSRSNEQVSLDALAKTSAKKVLRGSIMIGMYDTAALKTSIAAVDCSCNQAIAFASLDSELVDPIYVYFALRVGRDHFRRLQRGARQKNLNVSMIKEISLPLPSLTDQKQFCERIAVAGKLGADHRASLAELDALFASLQDRAFRGLL